jgi:hypothetical protein
MPKQIRAGFRRDRQNQAGDVRRPEQEEIPERTVEPTEVLRVALVLQIVENRDLGTGAKQGRGEAGVEHGVEPQAEGGQRQRDLFP